MSLYLSADITSFIFEQLLGSQFLQASLQGRLFFRQAQIRVEQSPLHLQHIIFKSSPGAAVKSVGRESTYSGEVSNPNL